MSLLPSTVVRSDVQFARQLRPLVQSGQVTCSVRIWKQPRVKVGGRYSLPPGEIEVTAVRGISRDQITTGLARRSGFPSVEELLEIAQHGEGEFVFLVEFVYHEPGWLPPTRWRTSE